MTDRDPQRPSIETLLEALEQKAPPAAVAWLRDSVRLIAGAKEREDLLAPRYTGALRRLGQDALSERPLRLPTACGDIELAAWSLGDAGRACLLVTAVGDASVGWETAVGHLFRHGDEQERASLARGLCLLPEPCSLIDIAQEVGRANSLRLYAALALDNPYPAACYQDHAFNQIVLKCLFSGLPVSRITGLAARANPELSRMCEDYRDERVAAGRSVPRDLWLALEPYASPRGLELILEALHNDEPQHRYNAALALNRRRSEPAVARALADRLTRETDPELRRLLESAAA